MNIGEAAERSKLPAKTLRYYEEINLVVPGRSGNGYRAYRPEDIHRLTFLQRARGLGFTIEECRSLLSLYADKNRASAEVKRFSGEYGLEGRIDLAFDDGEAFRILELKTGRPYDEHKQQVRCYALLWDKVARSLGKRVVGELLYSKDGSLKEVDRQDLQEERKIIRKRLEALV